MHGSEKSKLSSHRKPVHPTSATNHRSPRLPGDSSNDDNDRWSSGARRRRRRRRHVTATHSSGDEETANANVDDEHADPARSLVYSDEEASDEDDVDDGKESAQCRRKVAPLTLKKIKKASSGRRERRHGHHRNSSDGNSSDSSASLRRYPRSAIKQSITNDDFLTWGQYGGRFGNPSSFFGIPQSQSLETNLARDLLCGSNVCICLKLTVTWHF